MFALGAILLTNCTKPSGSLDEKLSRFINAKKLQAYALAQNSGTKIPPRVIELFEAIRADDSAAAAKLFQKLDADRNAPPPLWEAAGDWLAARIGTPPLFKNSWYGAAWEPIREAYWTYALSRTWSSQRLKSIVHEITSVIGTNNIYFGGTDVGRFAVTAAMEDHELGRPCFVLTQNLLCDASYRDYVITMFGSRLSIPTAADFVEIYNDYIADAKRRQQSGTLGKNEQVVIDKSGAVGVRGPGAYWELTGRFVNAIAVKNTDREIYIEQSEPLFGLNRHLVPAGPIFRFSRIAFDRLPEDAVQADRLYWSNLCGALLGDCISEKTTFKEICDFTGRVYVQGETNEYKGDLAYLGERATQEYFSKMRLSTADLYVWRCVKASEVGDKTRMWTEALVAMKQALALAPGSFETATFVKNTLVDVRQYEDAVAILEVCSALNPANEHLLSEIHRIQQLASQALP